MADVKGLVNDPEFKKLDLATQKSTLGQLDPDFASLSDSDYQKFVQGMTVQEGGFGHNLLEGAKGFAKGLGRDLLDTTTGPASHITPFIQLTPLGPVGTFLEQTGLADKFRQATEPTNTAQKVGNAAETVGTFLLPGGEEAEGVAGIARAGTRQGVKLARRITGRATAADTAGLASGIGSALEHPAADLAAEAVPGGPILLRIARKFGMKTDKLMSKDELAVELFKRNNGGKAPKTIAEQARARVDIDRFIKNIREGYEPKTGPKPPALKPENIDTGRSSGGKLTQIKGRPEPEAPLERSVNKGPFQIQGRPEIPEDEPLQRSVNKGPFQIQGRPEIPEDEPLQRSVNKGPFQIHGKPEPKVEEGPDLTRSQPSKLNVYEPKRPRTTGEKIQAGRARAAEEPESDLEGKLKESIVQAKTKSGRVIPDEEILSEEDRAAGRSASESAAIARTVKLANHFIALGKNPEEVIAMRDLDFNKIAGDVLESGGRKRPFVGKVGGKSQHRTIFQGQKQVAELMEKMMEDFSK